MSSFSSELDSKQAQLLMSQLLDGELDSADAERLNRYLESNPQAIDWMEGLDLVRDAAVSSSSSKDLSASKYAILEHIAREPEAEFAKDNKIIRFPSFLRSLAAAAAIAIVGAGAWIVSNPTSSSAEVGPNVVEFVATDIPDASTFVYTDEESGWTVVWVEAMEPLPEDHG